MTTGGSGTREGGAPSGETRPARARRRGIVGAIAAASGVAFLWAGVFLLGEVALISLLVGFYLAGTRRWLCLAAMGLVSPLFVFFLLGTVDYFRATAALQASGLPGTEFHNLDPRVRCPWATSGCIVNGGEVLWQGPYNLAVRLATGAFGLMRGAYDGPYPTKEEALEALSGAGAVDSAGLVSDKVVVGTRVVTLDDTVGRDLVRHAWLGADGPPPDIWAGGAPPKPAVVTAVLWQGRVLLLRIPTLHPPSRDEAESGPPAMIVAIDAAVGRPFAYWGVGGYGHYFPPVPWRRPE